MLSARGGGGGPLLSRFNMIVGLLGTVMVVWLFGIGWYLRSVSRIKTVHGGTGSEDDAAHRDQLNKFYPPKGDSLVVPALPGYNEIVPKNPPPAATLSQTLQLTNPHSDPPARPHISFDAATALAAGSTDDRDRRKPAAAGDGTGSAESTAPVLPRVWRPALVVMTYNRPDYLEKTLESLRKLPELTHFALFVSQDGHSPDLSAITTRFGFRYMQRTRNPRLAPDQGGTAYLAQHYKDALDSLFIAPHQYSHVVICEDDMLFAPDFLSLFEYTARLLGDDEDDLLPAAAAAAASAGAVSGAPPAAATSSAPLTLPNAAPLPPPTGGGAPTTTPGGSTAALTSASSPIWCVSSWNDIGRGDLVDSEKRLFRTDYFPGLGWMLRRQLWVKELSAKFPLDQWDHWMRLDTTHKGRECIVPEVNRNYNIGEQGTNMAGGSFYRTYLQPMALAKSANSWTQTELDALLDPAYDRTLQALFDKATYIGSVEDESVREKIRNKSFDPAQAPFVVLYYRENYSLIANLLQIMPTPRSTHIGVITVKIASSLIIFADPRITKYLPATRRHVPNPAMRIVAGGEGESCDTVCARAPATPPAPAASPSGAAAAVPTPGGGGVVSLPSPALLPASAPPAHAAFVCAENHFQWINECSVLMKHFACERGCWGGVQGEDIPNYVSNPQKPEYFQHCLTTDGRSQCSGRHVTTSRLCPCIPR